MLKIPIKLTDLELWAIAELAKRRNKQKDDYNIKSARIDKWITDTEAHYIGIKAEYAVSKLLDVPLNTEHFLGGDPGYDLLYRGITIDVKFSQLDFKFRPGTFKADVCVLVQPLSKHEYRYGGRTIRPERDPAVKKRKFAWKHVLVAGWVSRERFQRERTLREFKKGYGETEFLPATEASSMSELKKYAEGLVAMRKDIT